VRFELGTGLAVMCLARPGAPDAPGGRGGAHGAAPAERRGASGAVTGGASGAATGGASGAATGGVAAVRLAVEADERFDPEARAGLARFTGRMLAEGAGARSHLEIARAIESVGGVLETDEEGVAVKVLSADLPLALELAADLAARPTFPADRVEHLRGRIAAEIAADEDDPATVSENALRELVYEGHPYHHPAAGYRRTVAAISRADLVAHHARYWTPRRARLAIAGDVEPAAVRALVERAFGGWTGAGASGAAPVPEIARGRSPRTRHVPMVREQVQVALGHLGLRRTHPDHYALQVMDCILGTSPGFTDRLSRVVRDELGLAYSVRASLTESSGVEPGIFQATVGCSPGNRERAVGEMRRIIRRITREPVSAAELADAQAYLTGSFVFGVQTAGQLAALLISIARYGLGDDYAARYPALVRAVTVADVARVARAHLDPDALCEVDVGPALDVHR
jgi:zinc protease